MIAWLVSNARNLLAVASLLAIAVGFWLAWQPLGFIVPGTVVFGLLCWSHLRGA
jgi:hypothetical protein